MSEYLTDGFPTTVTFYAIGTGVTLKIKETSVTPPGIEGGEPIDTTTMRNTNWRTKAAQALMELTDGALTFQYDPSVYDQIQLIINVKGVIRFDLPDGSAVEFWGYLRNFVPGEHTIGAMPTATGAIVCTNQDDAGNEIGPDYQAAA